MLKRSVIGLVVGLCMIGLGSRWAGAAEAGAFWEKTQITGTVDTSYSYNINRPAQRAVGAGALGIAGGTTANPQTALRLFDREHNAIVLNLVEVAVETKPTDWATARFDLDFGHDTTIFQASGFDDGDTTDLQQGYIVVAADNGLALTVGKFVTRFGVETIERGNNLNHSGSLNFNLAIPFTHTGVKLDYPVNDDWSVGLDVLNGWNNVVDNNSMKTVGLNITGKLNDQWGLILNGIVGPEVAARDGTRRGVIDGILSFDPNETWHFVFQGNAWADQAIASKGMLDLWGFALYAHYRADSPWGATLRGEYYKEDAGAAAVTGSGLAAAGSKVYEATLTLHNYVADGLEARLEIRHDQADTALFPSNNGGIKKYQDTAAVEMVYVF